MAVFGVETDNNDLGNNFIIESNERLKNTDIKKNPFVGYIKIVNKDSFKTTSVIRMVPLWPNFGPWIALFSLIPIFIFGWYDSALALSVPLIFSCISFFWSEQFFYIVFKAGLKKAGYIGDFKKLKKSDLIDELTMRL